MIYAQTHMRVHHTHTGESDSELFEIRRERVGFRRNGERQQDRLDDIEGGKETDKEGRRDIDRKGRRERQSVGAGGGERVIQGDSEGAVKGHTHAHTHTHTRSFRERVFSTEMKQKDSKKAHLQESQMEKKNMDSREMKQQDNKKEEESQMEKRNMDYRDLISSQLSGGWLGSVGGKERGGGLLRRGQEKTSEAFVFVTGYTSHARTYPCIDVRACTYNYEMKQRGSERKRGCHKFTPRCLDMLCDTMGWL